MSIKFNVPDIKDGFNASIDTAEVTGLQQRQHSTGTRTVINLGAKTITSYADIVDIAQALQNINSELVNCPVTLTNICGENTYRGNLVNFATSPEEVLSQP